MELKFSYLMADGALYIRYGISNVHEEIIPTFCRFHFHKALKPRLNDKQLIPKIEVVNGKIGRNKISAIHMEAFNINAIHLTNQEKFKPSKNCQV